MAGHAVEYSAVHAVVYSAVHAVVYSAVHAVVYSAVYAVVYSAVYAVVYSAVQLQYTGPKTSITVSNFDCNLPSLNVQFMISTELHWAALNHNTLH